MSTKNFSALSVQRKPAPCNAPNELITMWETLLVQICNESPSCYSVVYITDSTSLPLSKGTIFILSQSKSFAYTLTNCTVIIKQAHVNLFGPES